MTRPIKTQQDAVAMLAWAERNRAEAQATLAEVMAERPHNGHAHIRQAGTVRRLTETCAKFVGLVKHYRAMAERLPVRVEGSVAA